MKRDEQSIESLLFRRTLPPALVAFIATELYLRCFMPLSWKESRACLGVVAAALFCLLLSGGWFASALSAKRLKKPNLPLQAQLREYCRLPQKKAAEVFALCCLGGAAALPLLRWQLHLPPKALWQLAPVWVLAATVPAIHAYSATNKLVRGIVENLLADAGTEFELVQENSYRKKKFLGLSINALFFMYVAAPLVVSGLLTAMLFHFRAGAEARDFFIRLCVLAAVNFANLSVNAMTFFARINASTRKVQEAIAKPEEFSAIPMDLATEISYTAYLVNKIIAKAREAHAADVRAQKVIAEKFSELPAQQQAMQASLAAQKSSLPDLQSAAAELQSLAEAVAVRIAETRTVAEKTREEVRANGGKMELNVRKMQEITLSNKTAIDGIVALSNKINRIWEIVNMIDGIANQTKIIAFNAELEAESISENKMKFKNVAYQIRNLTNQVQDLTHQIRAQIQAIQSASGSLIAQGNDCTEKVRVGMALTEELQATFEAIHASAAQNTDFSVRMSALLEQQGAALKSLLGRLAATERTLAVFDSTANDCAATTARLIQEGTHNEEQQH